MFGALSENVVALLSARYFTQFVFSCGIIATTIWPFTVARGLWAGALALQFLALLMLGEGLRAGSGVVLASYGIVASAGTSLHLAALQRFDGRAARWQGLAAPPLLCLAGGMAFGFAFDAVAGLGHGILAAQYGMIVVALLAMGAKRARVASRSMMASGALVSLASAAAYGVVHTGWRTPLDRLPADFVLGMGTALGLIILNMGWLAAQKDNAEFQLEALAHTDGLTGVLNRRGFAQAGTRLLHLAQRRNVAVTVLLIDIDHFKSINDRWGHDVGDTVLAQFGAALRALERQGDACARLGGEEFGLLLLGTDASGGHAVSERLRARLESVVCLPDGAPVRFSAGVARVGAGETDVMVALGRADRALYQAKASGRDCAVMARDEGEPAPV